MNDLREQVASALALAEGYDPNANPTGWASARGEFLLLADAALVVFAERERELRARIEALPRYTTRCRSRGTQIWVPLAALLALFDEAASDDQT